MKKHLIIGTAGHIDHGKSLLIKTLTGIDPDRLKEEKARGITIELGFAYLRLPSGNLLGIVDVPGHEKFVRHMVAGAAGLDLVILIIAADEGIMPQTREHLDICQMLGINRGLIVLTKKDLVEEEWLKIVAEEVRDFCRGTFLEGSPVIPLSSLTKEGMPELLDSLEKVVEEIEPRSPWGTFRMPIDRVFTMKGFGTVITGTTVSGKARIGDVVQIYPKGKKARIRGLQVHNQSLDEVEAGYRTAVNLQGVDKDEVRRGDTIALPGKLVASYIMDVRLHLLPSAPKAITSRTRVRFHIGTAEILGRVHIFEGKEMKPGESSLAQIRLEEPSVAMARDHFVIRSYSPSSTIGGGVVIDPQAIKYRRKNKSVIEKLKSLEKGSPEEAMAAAMLHSGFKGATLTSLAGALNIDEGSVASTLETLISSDLIHRSDSGQQALYFHDQVMMDLKKEVLNILEDFHRKNPLGAGLSKEELKSRLPRQMDPKILAFLLDRLSSGGLIVVETKDLRLAGHCVQLDEGQKKLRENIEKNIKQAGLAVPSPAELAERLSTRRDQVVGLIGMMVNEGLLVKIHDGMFVHRNNIDDLLSRLDKHFSQAQELTVGSFKEITGLSRKYSIPFLEYLDRHGVTLRVGDKRVMRKK